MWEKNISVPFLITHNHYIIIFYIHTTMYYFEKITEMNLLVTATAASAVAVIAVYYVFSVAQVNKINWLSPTQIFICLWEGRKIWIWFFFAKLQKPRIHTSNNKIRKFIQDHMKTLEDKYYPSIYFWEGRLQSVMGLRLRLSPTFKLPYRREIVPLSDG